MTRRIKVADFRGEDVEIEFPDGSVYPVRGDMPMEVVTYLESIEEDAADGEDDLEWFDRGKSVLEELIQEKTPTFRCPMMSPQELLGLMGALVGGESVGKAVAEALQDGADTDPTPAPRPTARKRKSSTTRKKATSRKSASRRVKR